MKDAFQQEPSTSPKRFAIWCGIRCALVGQRQEFVSKDDVKSNLYACPKDCSCTPPKRGAPHAEHEFCTIDEFVELKSVVPITILGEKAVEDEKDQWNIKNVVDKSNQSCVLVWQCLRGKRLDNLLYLLASNMERTNMHT